MVDPKVIAAIRAVVDYNWASEHADYDRTDEAGRERHVFRSLLTAANWLNGRALHEHALVESVPVLAGDRVIGWKVLLRGLLIGMVRPAGGPDSCTGRAYLCGRQAELGIFPTRDAAALAIVTANTLHGYPPDVREHFVGTVGGQR